MRLLLCGVILCSIAAGIQSGVPETKGIKQAGPAIFAANRQAVVHVSMATDSGDPNAKVSAGSGFIVSSDGYVLTAKHVIASYKNASVTPIRVRIGTLDGIEVEADPVELGVGLDVILLKLRNPQSVGLDKYPVERRGDASRVAIGQPLFIIGFNYSTNISIAQGNLGTNFGGGPGGNLLWSVNAVGAMFGMSGAPVFSDEGTVVGIIEGGQPGTGVVQMLPEDLLEPFSAIPHWTKTLEVSSPSEGISRAQEAASNQVNIGCDQTLSVETPVVHFGRNARDVQVNVYWRNTDNLQTQNQSVTEVKDPQTNLAIGAKGIGIASGRNSQLFAGIRNCPGGGHGELVLHATWKEDEQ